MTIKLVLEPVEILHRHQENLTLKSIKEFLILKCKTLNNQNLTVLTMDSGQMNLKKDGVVSPLYISHNVACSPRLALATLINLKFKDTGNLTAEGHLKLSRSFGFLDCCSTCL